MFVISIDLEMSWGSVHHGRPHDALPYAQEREVVSSLLELMDAHGVSATWAVVGHLLLAECSPRDGVAHPEVSQPPYPWLDGGWYDLDPGENVAWAPTWYGPDLIDAIEACPTPQEIGSHSFGHIIVGDPACTPQNFRDDLAAARNVAEARGIELRSFVYPRNSVGHTEVLAAAGFTSYRSPAPPRFSDLPAWARGAASVLDRVVPLTAGAVTPVVRDGLVDVPQTYLFDPDSRTAERLGTAVWSRLVRRRLRHAVRTRSLFHLWFHTHNLASRPRRAREALEMLFTEARREMDAGRLENLTMGQIADQWVTPDVAST